DHALGVAVGEDRIIGMVVNVDKARSDNQAVCVDGAPRGTPREPAEGYYLPRPDSHVPTVGGVACAIDDAAVYNENVKILSERRSSQDRHCKAKFHNAV